MNPEVIPKENRKIFSRLFEFKEFYLAGGTALALQIGHRLSIDFDFFSDEFISKNLLSKLESKFKDLKITQSVNNSDELTVFLDGVKLTFLYYPFALVKDLVEYEGVSLMRVEEIAATKAYTIGRRGTLKDYIDLYFILSQKYSSLNDIINLASKKYGEGFNSRLFLEQLIYLEDIEEEEVVFLAERVNKKKLKGFFEKKIKEIEI